MKDVQVTDTPHDPKPTDGMVDYNRHSTPQKQAVHQHADHIRSLVEGLEPEGPVFRLIDLGCGPGQSTIGIAEPAIDAVRAASPDRAIAICHADQPGNDWNALFVLVSGPDGYLTGVDGVRTEASIGSFYDRMASPQSVDLATCFGASHWLRETVSLHAPDTIWFADLEGEAREQLESTARHDWTRFLQHRAEELKPGGKLLVSTLGAVPEETEVNGTAASGRGTYRAIGAVAHGMAQDGWIDPSVLDRFLFPLWFMTAEEMRDPLETDPELLQSLVIEELSIEDKPSNDGDLFSSFLSDPDDYGRHYAGFVHAFGDSTLRQQLFAPSANAEPDAEAIASEFYRRFETLYRDEPGQHAFEAWHITLVVRKL